MRWSSNRDEFEVIRATCAGTGNVPARGPNGNVGESILRPGRNCWRIEDASRAAVLVDAESYFARVKQVLLSARRLIMIVGWDFDAMIRLEPDGEPFGPLLRSLVDACPDLEIRILIWNLSTLHAPSAPLPLLLGDNWNNHPRIELRLDTDHPIYAAQHEKIVAVNGSVAFVGGIDLTVDRWDTNEHRSEDARRITPAGVAYGPVHDIQMLVEGEIAGVICDAARDRWRQITGESIPPPEGIRGGVWPNLLEPEFGHVRVAAARTRPSWDGQAAVTELAQLARDAIASARRSVYIEAQYFTDFELGEIIARRLKEPAGPEFVIIVTRAMHGFIEGAFMHGNRRRLVRRLKRADRYGRLRVYHAIVPAEEGSCEVLIHAKLLIVDDRLLRIGSSNLNNRSVGLDREFDLAIEAEAASPALRLGIRAIRDRLLAEHLGATPDAVAEATADEGSLISGIERLNNGPRGLSAFKLKMHGPVGPMFGTGLIDPARPSSLRSMLWPKRRRHPGHVR